jgi:hypothetical protein
MHMGMDWYIKQNASKHNIVWAPFRSTPCRMIILDWLPTPDLSMVCLRYIHTLWL